MTHEEFLSLVKQPALVASEHVSDLKEMVDMYPYFASARLFHAKALQKSNSILFGCNLKFSSLYSSNRRWLYYYIHPEKNISREQYRRKKTTKSSGDYFDMMNVVESKGGDTKQTLKNMAERLRSARAMVTTTATLQPTSTTKKEDRENLISETSIKKPEVVVADKKESDKPFSDSYFTTSQLDYSESNAKKLIQEHKYAEAIKILRVLNLNNPKKSVYFADQIRFLEKVIANSKK